MRQTTTYRSPKDHAAAIEVKAIVALHSTACAWEWMKEPRPQFNGLSAREMMQSDVGRILVEQTLDHLQQAQDERLAS